MPDVVAFLPDNHPPLIVEIASGVDNTTSVQEIYSEWIDWARDDATSKYPFAFRYEGYSPTGPGEYTGTTFFLQPPWKFRPAELDHKWTLDGNIVYEGGEEDLFVDTVGAYTVRTAVKFSNIVNLLQSTTRASNDIVQGWAYDPVEGLFRGGIGLYTEGAFVELDGAATLVIVFTDEDGTVVHTSSAITPESDGMFHYEFEHDPSAGHVLRAKALLDDGVNDPYSGIAMISVM